MAADHALLATFNKLGLNPLDACDRLDGHISDFSATSKACAALAAAVDAGRIRGGKLIWTLPSGQTYISRAAVVQSMGALANETSQELGGSCANTRGSDIVSAASPDTIGPCSGSAIGAGELRNVLAAPPTISTQGNSTIPTGPGWAIGGCSSSAIPPAGHRSGASRTNSMISGNSAARRSRVAVSPG